MTNVEKAQCAADHAALNLASVFRVLNVESGVPQAEANELASAQLIGELMGLSDGLRLTPDEAAGELLRSLAALSAILFGELAALTGKSIEDLIQFRRMEVTYKGSGPALE
ncbi:hypothetical protein DR950_36285 [Kitasatospora xanthocidica]|uniref:Uncharacterized protein n=1 Tax=Kitasatospora xanthocidica TaxID=83382 RepID=A0A373A370_9ACTN|nr:hypothetical protein [Kitasatospora xanthocidica]RGD62491.1 hypothetical protein DR950_36285 [Kitasatospora xanthocidica]